MDLGFENFEKHIKHFFDTLLPSNKTYEYFIDQKKVKADVNKYLGELSLLNSLTKIDVKKVIPLLIAERVQNGKIDVFDLDVEKFTSFEFRRSRVNENIITQTITFCN